MCNGGLNVEASLHLLINYLAYLGRMQWDIFRPNSASILSCRSFVVMINIFPHPPPPPPTAFTHNYCFTHTHNSSFLLLICACVTLSDICNLMHLRCIINQLLRFISSIFTFCPCMLLDRKQMSPSLILVFCLQQTDTCFCSCYKSYTCACWC